MRISDLVESLDSPVSISWKDLGNLKIGSFAVANCRYKIYFEFVDDYVQVMFEEEESDVDFSIKGKYNSRSVFSTIKSAVSEVVDGQDIYFSAGNERLQKFYSKMVSVLPEEIGYHFCGFKKWISDEPMYKLSK